MLKKFFNFYEHVSMLTLALTQRTDVSTVSETHRANSMAVDS